MKVVLTCPPTYYQIKHPTNSWMNIDNPVDIALAYKQYRDLINLYHSLGIQVIEMPPIARLTDMTFAANFGAVQNDLFVPSNFRYEHRRDEALAAAFWLSVQFKYKITRLPKNIFFEGQGDLIACGNKYFLGHGFRSSIDACGPLVTILKRPIIPLKLVREDFYHLDTCFTPLKNNAVLIVTDAFDDVGLFIIAQHFKTVLHVPKQDYHLMPCNLMRHGNTVIVAAGISCALKQRLQTLGYHVFQTPMSEFIKGGGSVKCLTLELT